ncbi:MAG: hypothetical protein ACRC8S_01825 [Fimbriiglobus sp.]
MNTILKPRWAIAIVPTPMPPTPRQTRRASARTLVYAVLAFVLIQAGLNWAIRTDAIPIRDPIFSEKATLLTRHPAFFGTSEATRILALGSSRTHLGFDAQSFAATFQNTIAFNFGTSGGGPVTNWLYFQRLLDMGVQLDGLILEIHPSLIVPIQPDFESRWLQTYRMKPAEPAHLRSLGWNQPDLAQHSWQGWFTSTATFKLGLLNHYSPVLLPSKYGLTTGSKNDAFGFVAGTELDPKDRPRALEASRKQYAECFTYPQTGGSGPEAIRRTIALAQSRGIRVSLMITPEAKVFRDFYTPGYLDDVRRLGATLAKDFGIPCVDATEAVPDAGFADGHHLTATGAKTLTTHLAHALRPWMQETSR